MRSRISPQRRLARAIDALEYSMLNLRSYLPDPGNSRYKALLEAARQYAAAVRRLSKLRS